MPRSRSNNDRSSYEFMVALVIAGILQFIPGWKAETFSGIVVVGIDIYFCVIYGRRAGYGKLKIGLLSLILTGFLCSLMVPQITARYSEENIIPPTVMYMKFWGEGILRLSEIRPG